MSSGDVKYIADHMGHDLNIHSNIYSLQTSLVERAKVARILVAVEQGELHQMDKKTSVDQIDVDTLNVQGICYSNATFCQYYYPNLARYGTTWHGMQSISFIQFFGVLH